MTTPSLRLTSAPPVSPSQVFYYLGELNDALNYALCAGSLFDVNETSDYVRTLLGASCPTPPLSLRPVVSKPSRAEDAQRCSLEKSSPRGCPNPSDLTRISPGSRP